MRRLRQLAIVIVTVMVFVMNYSFWVNLSVDHNKSQTVSKLTEKQLPEKSSSKQEVPTARTPASTTKTTTTTTTPTTKSPPRNNTWRPFYDRTRPDGKPDLPRMLFWTTIYGDWYSGLTEEGVAELEYRGCSHRCYIANDRRMLSVSDAVVFYGRDTDPAHMPQERAPFQKWVYWSLEPPWHTPVILLKSLNNTFNWTMTYRLDSDVLNTYATIRKLRPAERPYSKESLKNTWKGKYKTAVWAVSSCKTSGKREHYIEELQKYLYVDVYGKCGENVCPKDKTFDCRELFAKNYFFYLSFENCICKDYVTEKLYKMLLYNIIPVVFGGANYSDVAPPGSYIDALSFESPMHLAHHLNEVARNFTTYERHFQWKSKYKVEPLSGYDLCNLCRKLYSEDFKKNSVVPDMYHWWNTKSHCRALNRDTQKFEY